MIIAYDQVLADPDAYRQAVLAGPFSSVPVGDEVVFHGIQPTEDPTVPAFLHRWWPHLVPTLSFFRQSPAGQPEPNYVHTDRDMGDWTAILYLNPTPAPGDGTLFWRHRATGAELSQSDEPELEQAAWRDPEQWQVITRVEAKFGRLVLFSAAHFHSRAIPENYGAGEDARLIQVVFGTGVLPENHTPLHPFCVSGSRSPDSGAG